MTTDIKELVSALRRVTLGAQQSWMCGKAADALEALTGEVERLQADKDGAYSERNQLVAFLTRCFPSWRSRTDIPGWMPEWHGCVYIETPEGQLSWHYHDREAGLFEHLDQYPRTWDGHTTEDKYQRLARLQPNTAERDRLKAALVAIAVKAGTSECGGNYVAAVSLIGDLEQMADAALRAAAGDGR